MFASNSVLFSWDSTEEKRGQLIILWTWSTSLHMTQMAAGIHKEDPFQWKWKGMLTCNRKGLCNSTNTHCIALGTMVWAESCSWVTQWLQFRFWTRLPWTCKPLSLLAFSSPTMPGRCWITPGPLKSLTWPLSLISLATALPWLTVLQPTDLPADP